MANELAALTIFTGNLFRHAYFILPWFCRYIKHSQCRVDGYGTVLMVLSCLKKNRPMFFGPDDHLAKANEKLAKFYECLPIVDGRSDVSKAIRLYSRAWHHAYNNRRYLQLRGHETRLMRYFHEITCKGDMSHFPELLSMARCVDSHIVALVRSIRPPDGWTARAALEKARRDLSLCSRNVFGCEQPKVELLAVARKRNRDGLNAYQAATREFKRMVHLRISEMFDERNWHPTIDSATLHVALKNEGLEDYLPYTFRGRVGVQPTGYPLTFYTYDGLELEKPPLHDVRMNVNYGTPEEDKDYGNHPVTDGTFYCTSRPQVGQSEMKYYTLAYKRRARRMKYETVARLAGSVTKVRRRLLKHVNSEDRDTWVRALMCLIIDRRCARIGNIESTKGEKKTYGITTLMTKKHVQVVPGQIILKYAGKHERPQTHTFTIYTKPVDSRKNHIDAVIADRLLQLVAEKNPYLFTRANGKPLTPQSVNEYFTTDRPDPDKGLPEGGAGAPCTVHNLRNYHATNVFRKFAARFARQNPSPAYEDVLAAYQGRKRTNKRRACKGVLDTIAEMLGNTPAICRKAYIDPREQLLFFKQFGFRPPDCIIRDLFVHEPADPYGVDNEQAATTCTTPCRRKTCQLEASLSVPDDLVAPTRRRIAAGRRKKAATC